MEHLAQFLEEEWGNFASLFFYGIAFVMAGSAIFEMLILNNECKKADCPPAYGWKRFVFFTATFVFVTCLAAVKVTYLFRQWDATGAYL